MLQFILFSRIQIDNNCRPQFKSILSWVSSVKYDTRATSAIEKNIKIGIIRIRGVFLLDYSLNILGGWWTEFLFASSDEVGVASAAGLEKCRTLASGSENVVIGRRGCRRERWRSESDEKSALIFIDQSVEARLDGGAAAAGWCWRGDLDSIDVGLFKSDSIVQLNIN